MYQTSTGVYDWIPDGMREYINYYGCHFNKKLCKLACSRMYKVVDGHKEYIKPYTKEDVDELLGVTGIRLERNKLYDSVYVANMAQADFYGSSIEDKEHLAKYIKDVIDDPDATEGFIFNRFYSDCMFMNNPIEWEDVI